MKENSVTLDATTRDLPAFRIHLEDGTNYVTSMAKCITLKEAEDYFLGQILTMPDEVTELKVIKVEQCA